MYLQRARQVNPTVNPSLVGYSFGKQLQSSQLEAKMWRADSEAARGDADGDDGFGGAGVLQ